ncbi:MAG: hypothetical protein JNJ44_05365 [Zoogloeaceae bacterium]|nr:hypothetical protein [Zoogloeaceae bacterium]
MRYVRRNAEGEVIAVSLIEDPFFPEAVPDDSLDLAALGQGSSASPLADTDMRLVRVLEDLIDVLITKEVIRFTDLPAAAQEKLLERRTLRHALGGLNLLDDGGVL